LLLYDLYKQKSPASAGLFYAPTFLKNNTGSIKQTKNDFTHQVRWLPNSNRQKDQKFRAVEEHLGQCRWR